MEAYHVKEIPDPSDIGPHKNIILHVGLNDIKHQPTSHVPVVLQDLEQKCTAIMDAFPKSNVYVCPLLPTKDPNNISRVGKMNFGIYCMSEKYTNLLLVDNYFDLFASKNQTLRPDLGRFWHGKPASDDLHIGKAGTKLLARCLKHTILKRKGPITQYAVGNSNFSGNIQGRFDGDYRAAVFRSSNFGGQYNRAVTPPNRPSHDGFTRYDWS